MSYETLEKQTCHKKCNQLQVNSLVRNVIESKANVQCEIVGQTWKLSLSEKFNKCNAKEKWWILTALGSTILLVAKDWFLSCHWHYCHQVVSKSQFCLLWFLVNTWPKMVLLHLSLQTRLSKCETKFCDFLHFKNLWTCHKVVGLKTMSLKFSFLSNGVPFGKNKNQFLCWLRHEKWWNNEITILRTPAVCGRQCKSTYHGSWRYCSLFWQCWPKTYYD